MGRARRYSLLSATLYHNSAELTFKMFGNRLGVNALLMATVLALGASISMPAFAQNSTEGSIETEIAYRTEYPRVEAEGETEVAVQTEHHLYKPGDTVRITGSVSEEMREEAESDTVTIQLTDADGTVAAEQQVTIESNGEYEANINLDSNAESGEYSAGSKLVVQASLLGLLDAELVAKLESPKYSFVVGAETSHEVEAQGGETFDIEIASNSNIGAVELNEEAKLLSFTVEGETGTNGVTEVTIPKAMLSGEMMVLIDGQAVSSTSSDVILKSETEADVTFEINYSHSEHTIEVTGTNVVPEFPMTALIMAAAVGSVIVFASRTAFRGLTSRI